MGRKGIDMTKKVEAIEKYKRGEASLNSISCDYCVDMASLRQWIANYEAMDPSGLAVVYINNRYTVDLKNRSSRSVTPWGRKHNGDI